jgi:Peptidase family M28
MEELYPAERVRSRTHVPGIGFGTSMIIFLTLLTIVAVYMQTPPGAVPSDASALVFSSGRAMKRLEVTNRKPHPVGSLEHAEVQNYILRELSAEGLDPKVQEATVTTTKFGDLRAATVRNIAARLPGTSGGGKAVLITGHYDTVPTAMGASDDGASVAAMLETVRALKAGAPLKNDVIFLFTDAEEIGLLGARAFVDEHPWAKDVALVLNFEARGASGPSMMFETSNGNGWLIEQLAKAAPHPMANSLSYEIYKLLGNNTDLTIFKSANVPGMNFAFIDSPMLYHTRADSIENIDERSLQHQGSYILSLAQHFGNVSLDQPRQGNAIYFDVLGLTLLHYPAAWVLPLLVLTLLALIAVMVLGFRRKKLTVKGIFAGFLLFVLNIIVAAAAVTLVWWLIAMAQQMARASLLDDFYRSKLYFAGFVLIAVAVIAALNNFYRRRVSTENLAAGAFVLWFILLALASVLVPGGSYLLLWPLLFSLAAFAFMLTRPADDSTSATSFAILSLAAIPAIVLLVPMIYQIFVAMGLVMIAAVIILVVLLSGLLVPHFALIGAPARRWLPIGAMLAAVIFIAIAIFNPGFDRQHPKSDSLFYVLNADTGKAVWASSDSGADEWTSQIFQANAQRTSLKEYMPLTTNNYLNAPAPAIALQPADVRLVADNTQGDVRTLVMHVTSSQGVVNIAVPRDASVEIVGAAINGKRTENVKTNSTNPAAWELRYWSPPKEGFDLALELKGARPVPVKILEQWYALPEVPGIALKPRPDYIIPAASPNSDQSLVTKSYSF